MVFTWRRPLRYFSAGDEDAFFRWLQAIPGIVAVEGSGRELAIRFRSTKVSSAALTELIALYRRYDGDLADLAVFESRSNRKWFRNPGAYWYRAVSAISRNRSSERDRLFCFLMVAQQYIAFGQLNVED